MIIFSCVFHYLNNLINWTYSVPSISDNWRSTVSEYQGLQNDPIACNMFHLPLSFICKHVFTYEEFKTIYILNVYVRQGCSVLILNHMQFFTPGRTVVWLKESVFSAKHTNWTIKKISPVIAIVYSFLTVALDGSEWLSWCTNTGYEAEINMPSNCGWLWHIFWTAENLDSVTL
jgi:hypothetical protein